MTPAMRASRILGWVSFAIGAAELLAPKRVARAVGMPEDRSGLLRAYGAREMVAGVGAHSVYPVPALWSRVAGDLLDLGTLAVAARKPDGGRDKGAWIAMATVLGITVIDAIVASKLAGETAEEKGNPKDYSDRSGFPGGVEAARGAGIAGDASGGKAGGAAAGDSSPAGKAETGRSSTDLTGAPASQGEKAGGVSKDGGSASGGPATGGGGTTGEKSSGFIGSVQTMTKESQAAVPEAVGYTPV
jgi:hypothetical protein